MVAPRVHTVIPPFFFGPIFDLPALVFLGWWLLLQFFNGAMSLAARGDYGGVAWWAHVGGFIFGMIAAGRKKPQTRYRTEAPYWG